jgi:hypothetical protein
MQKAITNARIVPVIINRNNVLKIQIFLSLIVFFSPALAMEQSPEPFHDMFPNEVVRMFLEHMSSRQRFSVARVSLLWRFLAASFNDVPKLEKYPANRHWYIEKNIAGLRTCIEDESHTFISLTVDQRGLSSNEQAEIMALGCSPKVVSLGISHGRLNSEQLAALADNYNLWVLRLVNVLLDRSSIDALVGLIDRHPSLEELHLSQNGLCDTMLESDCFGKAIGRNNRLQRLIMNHNNLTCAQGGILIEACKTNKSITSLNLTANNIGDDGAEALASVIMLNTQLNELYLGYNNITDKGAQGLRKALENNTGLTDLALRGNGTIKEDTLGAIKALLKRNKRSQANSITK